MFYGSVPWYQIQQNANPAPPGLDNKPTDPAPAPGMPLAFANIYADLAEAIAARIENRAPDPVHCHYPTAVDGLRTMAARDFGLFTYPLAHDPSGTTKVDSFDLQPDGKDLWKPSRPFKAPANAVRRSTAHAA